MLKISPALVHLWAKMGILMYDQRVNASKLWVRVTEADIYRLNGSTDCTYLPTIAEVMMTRNLARDEVWALVRAGEFVAFRSQHGGNWEWRLKRVEPSAQEYPVSCIVADKKGTPQYG
jgi:hypothetical protein